MLYILQIYLCGLPGKKLEKLRRLVNAAGGLRFNQPSEELTHVVMGELDQDLKNFLTKATHRFEQQRFLPLTHRRFLRSSKSLKVLLQFSSFTVCQTVETTFCLCVSSQTSCSNSAVAPGQFLQRQPAPRSRLPPPWLSAPCSGCCVSACSSDSHLQALNRSPRGQSQHTEA